MSLPEVGEFKRTPGPSDLIRLGDLSGEAVGEHQRQIARQIMATNATAAAPDEMMAMMQHLFSLTKSEHEEEEEAGARSKRWRGRRSRVLLADKSDARFIAADR